MISFIISIVLAFCISFSCSYLIFKHLKRPIIYKMESDKWIYTDEIPIPEGYHTILITDGIIVDTSIGGMTKYDRFGKSRMGYDNENEIIAWMPLPQPSKNKG